MCDWINESLLGNDPDSNQEHPKERETLINIFNIPLFFTSYLNASKDTGEEDIVYK